MERFAGRFLRGCIVCRKADELLVLAAADLGFVSIFEWETGPKFNLVLDAHDAIEILPRL